MSKITRLTEWVAYTCALLSIIAFYLFTKPPISIWDVSNLLLGHRELHPSAIYALRLLGYIGEYSHIIFPCAFATVSLGWFIALPKTRIVFFFTAVVLILALLLSIYLGFWVDEYLSSFL